MTPGDILTAWQAAALPWDGICKELLFPAFCVGIGLRAFALLLIPRRG